MTGVFVVAIVFGSVITIVKMAFQHNENLERIKHGYPLISGERSSSEVRKIPKMKEPDVIDYTNNREQ